MTFSWSYWALAQPIREVPVRSDLKMVWQLHSCSPSWSKASADLSGNFVSQWTAKIEPCGKRPASSVYLSLCKRSGITSGTVYVFRLHQVLNWAVESKSKSHKQDPNQQNWEKLYRSHQRQEECDSCVTSSVIFWALISSHRSQKKEGFEIVASWSPSVSLNTTLLQWLATRSSKEATGRLWISPGSHTQSCDYQKPNPKPFWNNEEPPIDVSGLFVLYKGTCVTR